MVKASPWRRLMGMMYEGIILFGVTFFFAYGFSAVTQFKGQIGALRDSFQWYMVAVYAAYFGWFWSHGRRTLPMKTLQLQLLRHDGAQVEPWRALLRFALAGGWTVAVFALMKFAAISVVLLILPFLWSAIDREGRALYDIGAGTKLHTFTQST
jgi:uncharacterized RDD family membrane protein YckC